MNDSEQYHTGRAAAYYTMVGALRDLLADARDGQVQALAIRDLQVQVERWQIAAEDLAGERSRAASSQQTSEMSLPL